MPEPMIHATRDRGPQAVNHLERRLLARARAGDRRSRERLVRHYEPLVSGIARRYSRTRSEQEELEQAGFIGVVKAIDRFDLQRPEPVGAYVSAMVAGELRRHLRDTGWSVHVPRSTQEVAWRLPHAREALRSELGREPVEAELAERLGQDPARIREAERARIADQPRLLPSLHDSDPADAREPGAEDPGFARLEQLSPIRDGMTRLRRPERVALGMAYLEERSQHEIGVELGCSQMQVSRLLDGALKKLHGYLRDAA